MSCGKSRPCEDEIIDKFLDELEVLRNCNQLDKSNKRLKLAVASKIIDDLKNNELSTKPVTTTCIFQPTSEELRLKFKEYLLLKPPMRSLFNKNIYGNFKKVPANQGNNWWLECRYGMDERHSCLNCSSIYHHPIAFPTYKQNIKAISFSLEAEEASDNDQEELTKNSCKIRP